MLVIHIFQDRIEVCLEWSIDVQKHIIKCTSALVTRYISGTIVHNPLSFILKNLTSSNIPIQHKATDITVQNSRNP